MTIAALVVAAVAVAVAVDNGDHQHHDRASASQAAQLDLAASKEEAAVEHQAATDAHELRNALAEQLDVVQEHLRVTESHCQSLQAQLQEQVTSAWQPCLQDEASHCLPDFFWQGWSRQLHATKPMLFHQPGVVCIWLIQCGALCQSASAKAKCCWICCC